MDLLLRAKELIEKNLDRRAVNKAAMTSVDLATGGGMLVPHQGDKFIMMLKMQPGLVKACRVVPMDSPTERVDRILFTDRILHAGTENTALATNKQSKPTTSKVELSAKEVVAETQISYSALQDAIPGNREVRGGELENIVFQLICEQVAIDLEEFALNSDTASADPDLALVDGWFKLAEASHVYDHGGAALSKTFFKKTYLELPPPYRQKKRQMAWITSSNMEVEWADELADQGGTELAQRVAWGDEEVQMAYQIPFLVSQHVPAESGASSNIGKALLTHPKNLVLGLWRNIFMEVDRDIRSRSLIVVTSLRFDAKMEQVEGAAVGKNVKVK